MVAPASDLLGDLLKSFILFIGLPEMKNNLEGDYFDELRSPEIIMNDDLCINDYDLDMSNDVDELPITSPAAARLFGGDDGYQTYGREQRGSMTNRDRHALRDRLTTVRGDPG